MPLPEKEYFALKEVEERWSVKREDTIYFAENGLLEFAIRVFNIVIETGVIEQEPDGRWDRVLEDYTHYSGLLVLLPCDLALLLRRGSMIIDSFHVGEGRYGDIVKPEDGIEVHTCDLVVTRAERDRFEQEHGLFHNKVLTALPRLIMSPTIECSDDGSWIRVGKEEYLFSGMLQKTAIRSLYEAWEGGTPKLNMQALLEDIESSSRHISQIFGTSNRRWREIVGYGRGQVWLKTGD